jgi:hypothetical protein
LLVSLFGLFGGTEAALAQPPADSDKSAKIAALNTEMNDAIQKVKVIVNQPVARFARPRGALVGVYGPGGWFHEGAEKPDFNTVDVRQTQKFPYEKYQYVTSDLNPGVVFVGRQLEFNSMTKYFYTDRTLPKKRLSEAEMLEINRLYRIIGRCEQQLAALEGPPARQTGAAPAGSESAPAREPIPASRFVKAGIAIAIVLALYFIYRWLR